MNKNTEIHTLKSDSLVGISQTLVEASKAKEKAEGNAQTTGEFPNALPRSFCVELAIPSPASVQTPTDATLCVCVLLEPSAGAHFPQALKLLHLLPSCK